MALIYSPKIPTDGLIMLLDAADRNSYPGTGNVWYDLSSNGNNLTLFNSPTWTNQKYFAFNGSTHYGFNASIALNRFNIITLIFIVHSPWLSSKMLFSLGSQGYDLYTVGSGLGYNSYSGDGYGLSSGQLSPLVNKWTHLTCTLQQNVLPNLWSRIAINGIDQPLTVLASGASTRAFAGGISISTEYAAGAYFQQSNIQAIYVYNRLLRNDELKSHYEAFKYRILS